jgi:hypothetical protein
MTADKEVVSCTMTEAVDFMGGGWAQIAEGPPIVSHRVDVEPKKYSPLPVRWPLPIMSASQTPKSIFSILSLIQ